MLGFSLEQTVPDAEPFVFAIVKSGDVQIYLNAPGPAVEEYPALQGPADRRHADALHRGGRHSRLVRAAEGSGAGRVPLEKKWYGVTEFAFLDPDGYIITFAQPGS